MLRDCIFFVKDYSCTCNLQIIPPNSLNFPNFFCVPGPASFFGRVFKAVRCRSRQVLPFHQNAVRAATFSDRSRRTPETPWKEIKGDKLEKRKRDKMKEKHFDNQREKEKKRMRPLKQKKCLALFISFPALQYC